MQNVIYIKCFCQVTRVRFVYLSFNQFDSDSEAGRLEETLICLSRFKM
jgi:hypothetical protein